MNEALQEARANGWPLDSKEILQQRIEFEDRLRHRHASNNPLPTYTKVEKEQLSEMAKYKFGLQIMRFAISLARP